MKCFLALALTTLSFQTLAQDPRSKVIEISYPGSHQRYVGTIETVEGKLKADIVKKAVEFCGSQENIGAITRVEARFRFNLIDVEGSHFEGSYPLASGTATVSCND